MKAAILVALVATAVGARMAQAQELASDAGAVVAPEVAATPAERAEEDPVGAVGELVRALRDGNWRLAMSGALALLMMLLARARSLVSWFKGDRGGAVLVMLLGLLGSFSAALATSQPLGLDLLLGALGATWTAVGGYTWIKRVWRPADAPAARLPLRAD